MEDTHMNADFEDTFAAMQATLEPEVTGPQPPPPPNPLNPLPSVFGRAWMGRDKVPVPAPRPRPSLIPEAHSDEDVTMRQPSGTNIEKPSKPVASDEPVVPRLGTATGDSERGGTETPRQISDPEDPRLVA